MQKNPNIKRKQLAELLKLSIATIEREIAILKLTNKIARAGSNKTGSWKVLSYRPDKQ